MTIKEQLDLMDDDTLRAIIEKEAKTNYMLRRNITITIIDTLNKKMDAILDEQSKLSPLDFDGYAKLERKYKKIERIFDEVCEV